MIYTLLLLKGFQVLLLGWPSLEFALGVATFFVTAPSMEVYMAEYTKLLSYDEVPNFELLKWL